MTKYQYSAFNTVVRKIRNRPDVDSFLKGSKPLEEIFLLPNNLSSDRLKLYKEAYFGVGSTDFYRTLLPNNNKLYIKMEYANAMGNSHYSRFWVIYLFLCEILEIIHPDFTKIIEVTSGSSGIALARASEILGYNVTILVPSMLPEARIAPMQKKSVNVIKVDGYINDCMNLLKEMVQADGYYPTNHSEEGADIIIKIFSRIGHEISQQKISLDYAIIGMGNGTSTLAIAKTLLEFDKKVKIISYRPHFEVDPKDIVFGLIGANIECRHVPMAEELVDKIEFTTGINLAQIRDFFCDDTEIHNLGPSSLYGVYFALKLAEKEKNKKILTIGYDKNDRY